MNIMMSLSEKIASPSASMSGTVCASSFRRKLDEGRGGGAARTSHGRALLRGLPKAVCGLTKAGSANATAPHARAAGSDAHDLRGAAVVHAASEGSSSCSRVSRNASLRQSLPPLALTPAQEKTPLPVPFPLARNLSQRAYLPQKRCHLTLQPRALPSLKSVRRACQSRHLVSSVTRPTVLVSSVESARLGRLKRGRSAWTSDTSSAASWSMQPDINKHKCAPAHRSPSVAMRSSPSAYACSKRRTW